jgi:hypothetical protein
MGIRECSSMSVPGKLIAGFPLHEATRNPDPSSLSKARRSEGDVLLMMGPLFAAE